MGPAGAGSLVQVINAALANKARFDRFKSFFEQVGTGHAAGIWEHTPIDRPEFREQYQRQLAKQAVRSTAQDGI
jgi:chlorophyllide a reductase subunit Y